MDWPFWQWDREVPVMPMSNTIEIQYFWLKRKTHLPSHHLVQHCCHPDCICRPSESFFQSPPWLCTALHWSDHWAVYHTVELSVKETVSKRENMKRTDHIWKGFCIPLILMDSVNNDFETKLSHCLLNQVMSSFGSHGIIWMLYLEQSVIFPFKEFPWSWVSVITLEEFYPGVCEGLSKMATGPACGFHLAQAWVSWPWWSG